MAATETAGLLDVVAAAFGARLRAHGVGASPAEVIEEEKRRVADFGAQKERLEGVLAQFRSERAHV